MRSGLQYAAAVGLFAGLSITLSAGEQLAPATVALQLQLADVLYGESDYRAAMGVYLRAAATDDQALRNRAREGAIRGALRIGEFRIAAVQASALRASRPKDPTSLSLVGDSLWASGLFADAETAYRDALALDPGHPRARNGLARSLASRSLLGEAFDEVSAAIAASPHEPEFQHTLAHVNERMRRYDAAADAYTRFLELLSPRDRAERIPWMMGQVHFLRSFRGRTPYEMDRAAGTIHSIGFRLVKDKVMIRAMANGEQRDFAVDTGAEQTVISVGTARRLGVRPITQARSAGVGVYGIRGLQVGVLDSFEVGSLKLRHVPVLIKNPPLRDVPVDDTESFSPLALGLSMSVDYGTRQLVIADKLPPKAADFELPLRMHRLATVQGLVNSRPVSFIVDTGGEVISLNTTTANLMFRPADRRRIALRVYGTSGLDPEAYLLPGVNLDFDEIEYRNTPVVVLNLRVPSVLLGYDIGGIVGHKFLSRYRVDIDLQDSVVRLGTLRK